MSKRPEEFCRLPNLEMWPTDLSQIGKLPKCERKSKTGITVWMEKGRLRIKKDGSRRDVCSLFPIIRSDDFTSIYGETVDDVQDNHEVASTNFMLMCQPRSNMEINHTILYSDSSKEQDRFFVCGSYPPQSVRGSISDTSFGNAYNILLLGLDSISHLAALRYLPKTMRYLQSLSNTVIMEKYNIVADGTTGNLLALLTGFLEEELPESRRSHVHSTGNTTVIDRYPWIWDLYKRVGGYATHYIEDSPKFGTFHYRLVGFGSGKTPTDSFGRPCLIAAMQDEKHGGKTRGCIMSRYTHHILLESMREFFSAYADRPRMSLTFLAEMIHENPAYATLFDDDLLNVFTQIQNDDEQGSGPFANTVVVFFADHGSRIGKARMSAQGKIEERLPLMAVMLPKRLRAEWPEAVQNLATNKNRLVTMFDMHATLEHLLRWQHDDPPSPPSRGRSLFTEILANRTCSEAGIAPHWCTCLRWVTITRNFVFGWPPHVKSATNFALQAVNDKIAQMNAKKSREFTRCSTLEVARILSAESASLPDEMARFVRSQDEDGRVPQLATFVAHQGSTELIRLDMLLHPLNARVEAIVKMANNQVMNIQLKRMDQYEPHAWCQPTTEWPEFRPFCVCRR